MSEFKDIAVAINRFAEITALTAVLAQAPRCSGCGRHATVVCATYCCITGGPVCDDCRIRVEVEYAGIVTGRNAQVGAAEPTAVTWTDLPVAKTVRRLHFLMKGEA